MVNHARTLLLNLDSRNLDVSAPGTDYIDPTFRPLLLPQWARLVHNILFGSNPQQHYLNYQVYECLQILHSTEYVEYVMALDSRISYNLLTTPFTDNLFGITTYGDCKVTGVDAPIDSVGICHKEWRVVWDGVGYIGATCLTTSEENAGSATSEGGYTILPLPSSTLKIHLLGVPPEPGSWRVISSTRPTKSWSTVINNLKTVRGLESSLFQGGILEPYKTFNNLWYSDLGINYKLTGLLLAFVYRLEDIRSGRA